MDSNDKNNKYNSLVDLGSSDIKPERLEELQDKTETFKKTICKNLDEREENHSDDVEICMKRKNSESTLDMNDSQHFLKETVKRRRCGDDSNLENDILKSHQRLTGRDNKKSICEENKLSLSMTCTPGEWSYQKIIDYVKKECGPKVKIEIDDKEPNPGMEFKIRLQLLSLENLNDILRKLNNKEVERKLTIQLEVEEEEKRGKSPEESNNTLGDSRETRQAGSVSGDLKPLDDGNDSNNLHMKEEYLESLGIKPPVTKWVTVSNFRCDKSELKEVLELAGKVVICSVILAEAKYANVMYSHPLEAVQAISMLNGQVLYGKKLKIIMNNSTFNKTLLPKGLVNIGPGLGKYGKALPDLADQYKRFVKGEPSVLEANLFQEDFLEKIDIKLDPESVKFARKVLSPNSQSSKSESLENDQSELECDQQNLQNEQKQPAPSGSSLPKNNHPKGSHTKKTGIKIHNKPVTNNSGNFFGPSKPFGGPGPISGPVTPPFRGPMPGPPIHPVGAVQGPIIRPRGPVPGPVVGPRGPGFQGAPSPVYPNCPPIPRLESSNDPQNMPINGGMTPGSIRGPRSTLITGPGGPFLGARGPVVGPIAPMVSTMGPMPVPHRFTGPVSPMLGIRAGPNVGGTRGPPPVPCPAPSDPAGAMQFEVKMTKGFNPVLIHISNLPPTTNFVNLGQKLSEFGCVVFLEFTTPGCANVRFATPAEADRCLQNYRKVLG